MRNVAAGFIVASLLFAGCARKKESETAIHEQAKESRPSVALVPIIDHSASGLPWSLSDEFTYSIGEKLQLRHKVALTNGEAVRSSVKRLKESQDPFGSDTAWIKQAFQKSDFAAFIELVEHSEKTLYAKEGESPQNSPAEMEILVRLRLFDLKGEKPRVILQELLRDAQHIPKQFTKANFHQVPWGSETFDISPLGMAHAQLFEQIAARIEDYILVASGS